MNVWEIPQYMKYLDKMEYLNIEEHELYEYEFLLNNEYSYNSFFSFYENVLENGMFKGQNNR